MSENQPKQTAKRKAPRSAFKPGQSGNPGGRPAVVKEVQELARQHTTLAVDALVRIARSTKAPPAAIVAAANSILDRGYGRPASKMDPEDRQTLETLVMAALAGRGGA